MQFQPSPLVSVIIPCYNRAHIIGQAVGSVQAQTLQDWEMLIVDDGSADDLAGALAPLMAADARIHLLRHARNRGGPAARNTGIAAARGRFIAFLDSDDTWMPRKLERQAEATLGVADPDNVLCVTQTIVVLSQTRRIIRPIAAPAPGRSFGEFLYNDGGFAQSSSFFLAKSLAARFPFREHLRQMVDHLFFMEVGAAGAQYLLVPEPLTVWDNMERPDRISTGDSLAKWRSMIALFRAEATAFVPEHVLLAAEARFLTAHLWNVSPGESVALLWRARRSGALTISQALKLLSRNALPRDTYNFVRHWLTTLTRGRGPEHSY
jgi:glycosyltransferase involved in cell wall biosynthesis